MSRRAFPRSGTGGAVRYALERLEPRILFSADLAAFGVSPEPPLVAEWNRSDELRHASSRDADGASLVARDAEDARTEIVVVDAAVHDAESLAERLRADAAPGTTVYLLEAGADPLARLGDIVASHDGVDAVHLLTHGDAAELHLGGEVLRTADLLENAEALTGWGEHLGDGADILLYGCDLAAGADGGRFLRTFADLTGADVAASDDATGHRALGGNWTLERASGAIESSVIASGAVQDDWSAVMARAIRVAHETEDDVLEIKEPDDVGQQFVHTSGAGTYTVSQVDLLLSADTTTSKTITVTLRESWGGPILGQATYQSDPLTTTPEWVTFTFADVELDDGVQYLVRVSADAGVGKVYVGHDKADGYAGGDSLKPDGSTDAGKDINFRIVYESASLTEVEVDTDVDTYIEMDNPNANNGSATTLYVNRESTAIQNALIDFDVSGVPAGATIESARLELEIFSIDDDMSVEVREVFQSWTEDGATWVERSPGNPWNNPAYGTTAYGRTELVKDQSGRISLDVTALVRDWHTGAVTNNGLAVGSSDGGGNRVVRFLSSDAVAGPSLNIVYGAAPNTQPIITSSSAYSKDEGFAPIGNVVGFDPDGDPLQYAIVGGADDTRFSIDAASGALSILPTDYEAPADAGGDNVYDVIVGVTDGRGGSATKALTVTIQDVNEIGIGGVFDVDPATPAVTENAPIGTAVGLTAEATDADGTDTVTYALTNDAGGLFAVDTATGVVTVAGALDAESGEVRTITVRALSSDGTSVERDFDIAIGDDTSEFTVGAISDVDSTVDGVVENAAIGSSVGVTAEAADGDATDTVTYALVDSAGGRFAIDSATGVVTVNGALDHESASSHAITVEATSSDGSSTTRVFTIAVGDVDEFSVGGLVDVDPVARAVDENVPDGIAVGLTAEATDADGTDTVTYSLTDDAGGRFAIDATTGVVTVNGPLDHESGASRTITVRAASSDGSSVTGAFTIAVDNVDEFDVGPIVDADPVSIDLDEDAAVGTAIGFTAFATDGDGPDTVTYTLTDDEGGLFAIDATSGVVTVAGALDHENDASHRITIRALSSDGSSALRDVNMSVNDVDEFEVGPVSDVDGAADGVAENAAIGTGAGVTVEATDADGTDTVTYALTNDAGGRFAIDATTGVVTVAGALDHESASSHMIRVWASSSDGSSALESFTIAVGDVNESSIDAIVDSDAAVDTVDENSAVGVATGVIAEATDADGTDTVTYVLTSSAGGRFAIDETSGVVTVAGALDHESASSHTIRVRASSSDGSSTLEVFDIAVGDVNESGLSAVADADAAVDAVDENSAIGAVTGVTAAANDADGTDTVTYALTDDAGGLFKIDATSGVVTVAGALDHESAASHAITVEATSSDGSSTTRDFTIAVGDANESGIGAIADVDAAPDRVDENVAAGTAIGVTASASDADGTDTVAYALTSDAGGLFTIDATSGVVTVAGELDHESALIHTLTVEATSSDGSSTTRDFTIVVDDVNEFGVGAVSDAGAAANNVGETAPIGAAAGVTARASDADGSDTVTYALTDDAGGLFAIDATSGVVEVAGKLDHESAPSHVITVEATSSDGSSTTRDFTIVVVNANESSVGTITDTDAAPDRVDEDAVVGTGAGVVAEAVDADGPDTVTYALTNDAGGLFAIDATSGVVEVAGALDHESASSHVITVEATSSDGSSATRDFTIAIGDVSEFGIGPISDLDPESNSIAEDIGIGEAVGYTASAIDEDGTDTVTYSLTDDDDGRFAIDATSGVVTVTGEIDRESSPRRWITIRAESSDGSSITKRQALRVHDVDEFAIGQIADIDAAVDGVAENATIGTNTGVTADAIDADATATVTYALTGDAGGRFAIDATSGIVTVIGALDHEGASSHVITIEATSSDGSSTTRDFTIAVGDVNESEVSAVADVDATVDAVDENAAIGTAAGVTARATDADGTDTITYALTDDAGGRFAIDAVSGVVTVAGALDHESASSHVVTVEATSSDGSSTTRDFTIAVGDVNEFGIGPISDLDPDSDSLPEGVVLGEAAGYTASAIDRDGTDTVTYSLTDDDNGRLAIDATSGVVSVVGEIDRESDRRHWITIRAESSDGSSVTHRQAFAVRDVDEFAIGQIADIDAAVDGVAESAAIGTSTGVTAEAIDADATATVTYALTDDAGGRFAIDAASGVVTVAGALDHESASSHVVTVEATSSDGSSTTRDFTIAIDDVNEASVSAVSDADATVDAVDENSAVGTATGVTAVATDADRTDTITYTLTDDAGGLFAIDATSGVVTVAEKLDHEVAASHVVVVRALSSDGSATTRELVVSVEDVDESDVTPLVDADAGRDVVEENVAAGAGVGITAFASDADATDTVVYALESDAGGRFTIDASTGRIALAGSLDHEAAASHTVVVSARSSDGSVTSRVFEILVEDVNEAPTLERAEIEIDAPGDGVVATVRASDPDTGDAARFEIVGGASELFAIDATTGDLTMTGVVTAGVHELEIAITDGTGEITVQTLRVRVLNDAPSVGTDEETPPASPPVTEPVSPVGMGPATGGEGTPQTGPDTEPDGQPDVEPVPASGSGTDAETDRPSVPAIGAGSPSVDVPVLAEAPSVSLSRVTTTNLGAPSEPESRSDARARSIADTGQDEPVSLVKGVSYTRDGTSDEATADAVTPMFDEPLDEPRVPAVVSSEGGAIASNDAATRAEVDRIVLQLLLDRFESGVSLTAAIDELFGDDGQAISLSPRFIDALRSFEEALAATNEAEAERRNLERIVGLSLGIGTTAGFVTWLVKSGLLAAGAASSASLWRSFDPVPVVAKRQLAASGRRTDLAGDDAETGG